MLATRIRVGSLMALLLAGVLVGDAYLAPYYPFLFVAVLGLAVLGGRELGHILPATHRPKYRLCAWAGAGVLAVNWLAVGWGPVVAAGTAVILFAFTVEVLTFTADGWATRRLSAAALTVFYLGILPSFLVQQRFRPDGLGGPAVAATIIIPKVADVFALLTGMAFGRHKFTPLLSPKKTWEGFAGGLLAAGGAGVLFHVFVPALFRFGLGHAIAFGLLVGLAGVVGDLAESLLKRDSGVKDASRSIPGFGGVLDLIDSVLFAAPVGFLLLWTE